MTIENNVSAKPHIITYKGNEYDLQLTMYVVSEFEDFNSLVNAMGSVKTMSQLLATMMNSYILSNDFDWELVDANKLAACTNLDTMAEYTKQLALALGFKEPSALDKEIEEALKDEEFPEEVKN